MSGYSPSISTLSNGRTVTISGQYPFSDNVTVTVTGGSAEVQLRLRIPCWVQSASVSSGGQLIGTGQPCTFFSVKTAVGSPVQVTFHNQIRVRVWHNSSVDGQSAINNGAVEVHRGALLYALRPTSDVTEKIVNPAFPTIKHRSVTISSNATWAYGLKTNTFQFVENGQIPQIPFDGVAEPAVKILVTGRAVPQWTSTEDPPPTSPLGSTSPEVQLELVPYGSTNIRISVFPQICEVGTDPNCAVPPPGPPPPPPSPPAPAPPIPHVLPPNGQSNMNEPDNDLVHGGFSVTPKNNATAAALECFSRCVQWNSDPSKSPKCKVYTFIAGKPDAPNSGPWCWLKSQANPKSESGFVSGVCAKSTGFPCP